MRRAGLGALLALALVPLLAARADADLRQFIASPERTPANVARDAARHPLEELTFFGVRPDATVVEVWPGRLYWSEILAPYLAERGSYIAAVPDRTWPDEAAADRRMLAARPGLYGKVRIVELDSGHTDIAAPNSVDAVLTFRNLHNWMAMGTAPELLAAFHRALKAGGILGVEDHRGNATVPQDPKALNGYVRQDYAIRLIEAAGFKFLGSSEIGANPRDSKDYKAGVWTLPPTFALGQVDRAKYAAIGEADNFVLKFQK